MIKKKKTIGQRIMEANAFWDFEDQYIKSKRLELNKTKNLIFLY